MGLIILSTQYELQEKTFKNVAWAALNAKLEFYSLENSLKENSTIEIWVRKRYGNGEDEYDFFSMDIHNENWAMNCMTKVNYRNKTYYSLSGTDNAPSFICYNFSLQYLRLCPKHLISIYDFIFSLEEIEEIEKHGGWRNDWLDALKNSI